jgi:FkbM family methyltransferase
MSKQSLDRVEQAVSRLLGDAGLVIVDVGAAHGLPWHLSALRNVASTICCFEPDPEAAEALRRAAQERGQNNLKVFPAALASSDAERTLYVTNSPTGSSLLKPGSEFGTDFSVSDYFYPVREVTVRTRPLRDVLMEGGIPRVDTIKIDVQGAEDRVIAGSERTLQRVAAIQAELSLAPLYAGQALIHDMVKALRGFGYELADVHPAFIDPRDGRLLQLDGLFLRR